MRLGSGEPLVVLDRLAQDDEAELFVTLQPAGLVAKRFRDDVLAAEPGRRERIEAMVGNPPPGRNDPESGRVVLAWPTDLVVDDDRFVGFVMPWVDPAATADLGQVADPSARAGLTGAVSSWPATFTWRELLGVAAHLAAATQALHDGGTVIGDFAERRVRVHGDAGVTLVGCDAMQVTGPDGRVHPALGGAAEVDVDADADGGPQPPGSDLFALAVHIHRLLLEGADPFDGVWTGPDAKPERDRLAELGELAGGGRNLSPSPTAVTLDLLPPTLRRLMTRALVDGASDPAAPPTAAEWRAALDETATGLKTCRTVAAHLYPGHHRSCPWCARAATLDPPAVPG